MTLLAVVIALAVLTIGAGVIVWIRTDTEFTVRGHRIEDARFSIRSLDEQVTKLERENLWLRGQLAGLGKPAGMPPEPRHAVTAPDARHLLVLDENPPDVTHG